MSIPLFISLFKFVFFQLLHVPHLPGALVQLNETFCEVFPVDVGDCLLVEYFAVVFDTRETML